MNSSLLYPFIILAGGLQAAGNSMNAKLRNSLINPWLAASVSFILIVFCFAFLFMLMPTPLPSVDQLQHMRWWGPLGGLAGAVAVFGGLALVDKVGAGPFNGLLITANIVTSLGIDHFGWFGMTPHTQGPLHIGGALLMVGVRERKDFPVDLPRDDILPDDAGDKAGPATVGIDVTDVTVEGDRGLARPRQLLVPPPEFAELRIPTGIFRLEPFEVFFSLSFDPPKVYGPTHGEELRDLVNVLFLG